MEFELGLKLTHTRDDDLTSMAELRITQDPYVPLFVSKQTDSKFILTGHLRGYRKESIDIEINEAGNRIAISGKKPVQEMVLRGWIMQKKEVEIKAFRKVFGIPDRVILDKIKAKFNEETSNLTIIMPKSVKGYCGVVIEEMKEEEVGRGTPEATQNVVDKIAEELEMKPVAAGEDPEKGTDKEAPKEEIIEENIDQGGFETREAVGEEILEKEKPEETEKNVGGGESRALENKAAEAETERVEETIEKENEGHKIKSKEEKDKNGEESSSKPEVEPEVSKKMDPLQAEDTMREKIPEERAPDTGLEKHVPGPDMAKLVESGEHQSSLSTHVQEKQTTSKDHQMESKKPEELQKQEPSTEVEELQKQEPSTEVEELQKQEQEPSTEVEELQKQEPSTEDEELTKPEEPCQVPELEETQKNEIAQFQEKSDHQDATQMKKRVSKKNKVCTPLVVAGSTLLVSLIVFVFQLIRAKKR